MKSMVMQRFIMPALLALLAWPAMAQPAKETNTASAVKPKQVKSGDLAGNMELLNLWGERPEAVQRLYEAAYKILAARTDASFAELARDAAVQRLCAEAGVTHFGGPMLGGVRPDGAAVWLRTLRPARVEVRVTVNGQEKTFGPVASDFISIAAHELKTPLTLIEGYAAMMRERTGPQQDVQMVIVAKRYR